MAHGDITHLEIPVADFAAATAFYRDVFGWEIADTPGFEGYPMWQGPSSTGGGALIERTDDAVQPRSIVEIDSIDDALAKVEARGGRVLLARTPVTDTSWWAMFEDPDGNVLGLFEGSFQGEPEASEGA